MFLKDNFSSKRDKSLKNTYWKNYLFHDHLINV